MTVFITAPCRLTGKAAVHQPHGQPVAMPPSFFKVHLKQRTLASSLNKDCYIVCLLPCPPRVFPLTTLLQRFWLTRGRTLASDDSCLAHAM